MQDVRQKVLEIIARTCGLDSHSLESASFEQLGLSSLDAVSIAYELEQQFQIKIPDDKVYSIKTVEELIIGVQELLRAS